MVDRRDVLKAGLAAFPLAWWPWRAKAAEHEEATAVAPRPLDILVLGGTGFLGPHFVEAALARGHRLTLFNRGRRAPSRFDGAAFSGVEQLRGDRRSDFSALGATRRWDVVLDTSAYFPADVVRSATLLASRVGLYQIVSSISVYARQDMPNDEDSALAALDDPSVERVDGETFGGLKALCEAAAERVLPGRTCVVRPGLIVGPGDPTDRFTYWPARADRGGEMLAPGTPRDPVQMIDVRDLAAFQLRLLERGATGVLNALTRPGHLSMGDVVETCLRVAREANTVQCVRAPCDQPPGHDTRATWVPAGFLAERQVSPWQDMPVWMPPDGAYAGFARTSAARAVAAGLTFRPLETTVADTLAWWRSLPEARRAEPGAGLALEREAEVLQAWHAAEAARTRSSG
ncbi:NAD-dependent epimerase/dehydratase family protein [Luteimonas abyssi]|uniref:NAD-dependent epimerase/dehydratase family protein n=1 Tax=Luteimonas abyssi TaxID=1247514 RepID=UPI000A812B78|nr:NAD-dependent epimerase/dehydratase family protein [Luteimonas abyssi]